MVSKGGPKAIRLPPLKTLRVHAPKQETENPCIAIMSTVLGTSPSRPLSTEPCESQDLFLLTRGIHQQHAGLLQVTMPQDAQLSRTSFAYAPTARNPHRRLRVQSIIILSACRSMSLSRERGSEEEEQVSMTYDDLSCGRLVRSGTGSIGAQETTDRLGLPRYRDMGADMAPQPTVWSAAIRPRSNSE